MLKMCKHLLGLFLNRDQSILCKYVPIRKEPMSAFISACQDKKLEYLSLIGFRDDNVWEQIMECCSSTLRYLNLSNCCFASNPSIVYRAIEACSKLEHVVLYGFFIPRDELKKYLANTAVVDQGLVSPYWKKRARKLHEQFCKYGSCGKELSEEQIRWKLNIQNINYIPEPLAALLMVAREWHSIRY